MTTQALQSSELPELPYTNYNGYSDGSEPLYTADQMRDYARKAIAAQTGPRINETIFENLSYVTDRPEDINTLLVPRHKWAKACQKISDLEAEVADLPTQAIVVEAATDALRLILPMAKAYASANNVGSNQAYVQQAEDLLAAPPQAIAAQTAQAVPLCWVPEDELPESMPTEAYNALYPHSRVDVIREFPIYAAPPQAIAAVTDEQAWELAQKVAQYRHDKSFIYFNKENAADFARALLAHAAPAQGEKQ